VLKTIEYKADKTRIAKAEGKKKQSKEKIQREKKNLGK